MIRWSLLVFAACAGGAPRATPQVRGPEAAPGPQPEPAAPQPASQMLARVAYQNTNTWIDVAVDGTDHRAREICEALVGQLERRRVANLAAVVERGCAPIQLPANRRGQGFLTTDRKPLDPLELAVLGVHEPIDGATTWVSYYDTAAACERARAKIAAESTRRHVDEAAAVHEFIATQRVEAEARTKAACERADTATARKCGRDPACNDIRDHEVRECALQRAMRDDLREREAKPTPPPLEPPSCVAQ